MLESLEQAQERGANIICEVTGYECLTHGKSLLAPSELAIQKVIGHTLIEAGWEPHEMDVLSPHGSGTNVGNKVEVRGMKSVLGSTLDEIKQDKYRDQDSLDKSKFSNTSISALKGQIGHLNLASGATEAAILIKGMNDNVVPGTYGLKNPIDDDLNFTKQGEHHFKEVNKLVKYVMGFGGNMACLAFEKFKQ